MELKELIDTLRKAGVSVENIRKQCLEQFGSKSVDEAIRAAGLEIKTNESALVVTKNDDSARTILQMCELAGVPEKAAEYVRTNKSVDDVRSELIKTRSSAASIQSGKAEITKDERDKYRHQMSEALNLRCGMSDKHVEGGEKEANSIRKSGAIGLSFSDMMRDSLESSGISTRGMNKEAIIDRFAEERRYGSRSAGMATTSDFDYVLAASVNKQAQIAYTEAPATYQIWCGRGTLPDFKATKLVNLSGTSILQEVYEGGSPNVVTISDTGESVTLKTYGGLFLLGRKAFINDDLQMFDLIRRGMQAARRKVNNLAYGQLASTMDDTGALFNTTAVTTVGGHANQGASSAAISTTTIAELQKLLGLQKDAQGNPMNLSGRYFLVSKTKEALALAYIAANVPALVDASSAVNPYRGRFEVVADAEIDSQIATTSYFLTADPNVIDTVKVFFRNGQDMPTITQQESQNGDPLGVSWQIILDVAAKAVDFRGMAKNVGA